MKKMILFSIISLIVAFSCTKENSQTDKDPTIGTLRVTINSNSTKAVGSPTQAEDNTINDLHVFVFNSEGEKFLDAYRKVSTAGKVDVPTTVGNKQVVVLANIQDASWEAIKKYGDIKELVATLPKENVQDFVMSGEGTVTVASGATATLNITVKRLVSKIAVTSIKTSFASTPYAGETLTDVKLYLINAHGAKKILGEEPTSVKIYNNKKLVAADVAVFTLMNTISDNISSAIGDVAYTTKHHFYCYSNPTSSETTTNRYTRLVLEATLQGQNYFYPVDLPSIGRNEAYTVTLTVKRPGSSDPDEPLTYGDIDATISVSDWTTATPINKEF